MNQHSKQLGHNFDNIILAKGENYSIKYEDDCRQSHISVCNFSIKLTILGSN